MNTKKPAISLPDARMRLVRWMSGDAGAPDLISLPAVQLAAALAGPPVMDCESILPALEQVAALDDTRARTEMPVIFRHLDTCADCRRYLHILRMAREQLEQWEGLARSIAPRRQLRLITLLGRAWHWRNGADERPTPLIPQDFLLGRLIGAWALMGVSADLATLSSPPTHQGPVPPRGVAGAHGSGSTSPLALALDLGGGTVLDLQVVPDTIVAVHQPVWHLKFSLRAGSGMQKLDLELLDSDDRSHGSKTLRMDRPVEFAVPPPVAGLYRVVLTWRGGDGQPTRIEEPLPLGAARGGKDV